MVFPGYAVTYNRRPRGMGIYKKWLLNTQQLCSRDKNSLAEGENV
jgi:hypothetical protein